MIKISLKNFFINLKYVFTPLGALFLGVLVGVSVFLGGIRAEINYVVENVKDIAAEIEIDYTGVKNRLTEAADGLSWEDPAKTLKYIEESDLINETLLIYLETLSENASDYSERLTVTVRAAADGFKLYFAALLLFVGIGLFGGIFFTKYLIRRDVARRRFWKFVLVSVVDSLLSVTVVAFSVWLLTTRVSIFLFSSVAEFILMGCVSLFEAYIVQGNRTLSFKEIVNPKNALLLVVSDLLILLLGGVAAFAIALVLPALAAGALAVSVFVVALSVIGLNAEAYVSDVRRRKENGLLQAKPFCRE